MRRRRLSEEQVGMAPTAHQASISVVERVEDTPGWARGIGRQRSQFHREEARKPQDKLNRGIVLVPPPGGSL